MFAAYLKFYGNSFVLVLWIEIRKCRVMNQKNFHVSSNERLEKN
jgi:hypothetical protein